MRKPLLLTLSLFTILNSLFSPLYADPLLQKDDTLAIIGDSITELKGYSVFIEDYLLMCAPPKNTRIVQFGWGGSSAKHFVASQLKPDIPPFKPTVATTCFGMNDGSYTALTNDIVESYRTNSQAMIDGLKAAGVRTIVLGSPGVVDTNTYRNGGQQAAEIYNKTLAALRDIDKDLATKNNLVFADVHTPMMDVMQKAKAKFGPKYHVAGLDGIHPQANGHLVMAYAFLKALGHDGNIGAITVDLATQKATASEGHKLTTDSLKDNALEIESTRYPFCFTGKPDQPNATTGIIEFFPFNEDLNRFTLTIKNAPPTGCKITWGKSSKSFTADQLARGVNLAAEFLDNPFVDQFQKVHAAVLAQQTFQTQFIKQYVVNLDTIKAFAAEEDKPAFDHTIQTGLKKDQALQATAQSLVTPLKHTIKIEPAK